MQSSKKTTSELSKKLVELEVLNSELKSSKKSAKVYKQQPNSNVFFKDDRLNMFNIAKKDLDDLRTEYKAAEASEQTAEETEDSLSDGTGVAPMWSLN